VIHPPLTHGGSTDKLPRFTVAS